MFISFKKNVQIFSDALRSFYAQIKWEFGNQEFKTALEWLTGGFACRYLFLEAPVDLLVTVCEWAGWAGLKERWSYGIT